MDVHPRPRMHSAIIAATELASAAQALCTYSEMRVYSLITRTSHRSMGLLCLRDVQASDVTQNGHAEPSKVGGHSRQVEGGREALAHNAHK